MDTLQQLLDLFTDTVAPEDCIIGNEGDGAWFIFAYFHVPSMTDPAEGHHEIYVRGDTLREALCKAIAHPRFEQ